MKDVLGEDRAWRGVNVTQKCINIPRMRSRMACSGSAGRGSKAGSYQRSRRHGARARDVHADSSERVWASGASVALRTPGQSHDSPISRSASVFSSRPRCPVGSPGVSSRLDSVSVTEYRLSDDSTDRFIVVSRTGNRCRREKSSQDFRITGNR